ncbi:MAG TPA: LacI family DNA-binding transcriptional regulator [Geminicoccus sp.]|jgi:LacI family transcriptional regulator|uniref:LacI family DNA-binding transcriptional regulator n=1 Tax=Geminicoccus sp. TaxID=2024832 RepID=UPI002E368348|nr:LacI family DNA-binding transcriptional regulator [Geminicoccus sp.]HEX2527604.1 LacI family DNA-binding transcriptional regulator [Geminicoccus sp.]
MAQRPTIHAVAARVGVSTATVSKVVNGIETGVSAVTRAKVEAAVQELGYRPNRMGRNLRTQRYSTVGLVILDPSPRFLADPFTTNLVAGLANYLNSRGFGLLLDGILPGKVESSFLIRGSAVDGLCLSLSGTRRQRIAVMRRIARLGQPIVVFQDLATPSLQDACFIRQDDRGGATILARALLKRKPRRAVVVVSTVPWPAVEQRVAGIRSVLEADGVHVDLVECDETSNEMIADAINRYLDREQPPDLILGQNDQIAIAALHVLRRHGLQVPQDVGVTGFNAFPFMDFADPPLMTIRSAAYEMGERGAQTMLGRLENGHFSDREVVLPVQFVAGASA